MVQNPYRISSKLSQQANVCCRERESWKVTKDGLRTVPKVMIKFERMCEEIGGEGTNDSLRPVQNQEG